jgi:carbamoyltransferase
MLVRYHPTIGHIYVPNLRARLWNETGGYFVTTNALGFRSDIEYERKRGPVPRILMFGDSYTAGDNCANQDRYSDQLARMLGAEVYNFGLSGSGTDQHLLLYREFGRSIERDLVVICVQMDSIRRIQTSHRESIDRLMGQRVLVPKPYFRLENGGLVLYNVPVPRERPPAGTLSPATLPESRDLEGVREAALRFYRENLKLRRFRAWMRDEMGPVKSQVFRWIGAHPYPEFKMQDSPGWLLMKAILEQFVQEVAPTPVLIVPTPTFEYYLNGIEPVYQKFFAQLQNREQGVHVADVSTPLVKLPWKTRQRLSFRIGGHFTPFANERVARMLADEISERKLLAPRISSPNGARPTVAHAPKPKGDSVCILGISCFYHNSAASLIRDGEIVAAAEEERFTRLKNDRRFPQHAANYCLEEGGIDGRELDAVVYYDNAALTFERILHTQLATGAGGEDNWLRVMPSWCRYKLYIPRLIRKYLQYEGPVLQEVHHRSHAASAFYPSPFERAAILTVDGVGEWATASIGVGREQEITLLREMRFPHSLGLLYSAFTQFTGFKVNSGEYKMMGLAPYGEPKYVDRILEHIVDLKEDGSVELNLEYFSFLEEPTMTNEKFARLFGGPARTPDSPITRREIDLARSIQVVTEEAMLRMSRLAHHLTGEKYLCLAGGVALNCVANGRLLREGPFADIWIQPAAGDAGCALGAALDVYHSYFGRERCPAASRRPLQGGSYWGPSFSQDEIAGYLDTHGYPYRKMSVTDRSDYLARCLNEGKVVGHFSGRLEFGPRSLGSRSILGDARNTGMQAALNLKIKYRESFRPFAPSVLAERVADYFELDRESPYMLVVAPVRKNRRKETPKLDGGDLLPKVRQARSDIPAVTHVDYSARIQTVARDDHPAYYDLIRRFEELTGCAVIVNTSFNVRGEPIVCTPAEAYRCFMRTEMHVLALGDYVLLKEEQPQWPEAKGESLESEDVTGAEKSSQPAALIDELRQIFRRSFLPIAQKLRQAGAVRMERAFRRVPSNWHECEWNGATQAIFEYPGALDLADPDARAFTESMLRQWDLGAAQTLRPVIQEIVALGLKYPSEGALEEEVSESVYVMF